MQPTVDVKTIMAQFMERLSNYAASSAQVILNSSAYDHHMAES
jgi:hypothetical protein